MQIQGVELEVWLALAVAIIALGVWGLKRYQVVMADGKVSISEVIETIEQSEYLIDDVVDKAEEAADALEEAKAKEAEAESEAEEPIPA